MAAAAVRRMRGTVQAKLRPSPGLQVSGVLALLLASATMSSGKGGAAAGRAREDAESRARAGRQARPGKGRFGVSGADGCV